MEEDKKHKVLEQKEIDFFFKNGYLLVKNVYNIEELKEARNFFIDAFEKEIWKKSKYNSENIINDIYSINPKLMDVVFNEKYISVLKSILGEKIIWLPECAVHHNRFINWHKDTTEQEIKGIISHKNPDEFLLQCATYFQSNSNSGGGLTVIPGSHLAKDKFLGLYKRNIFSRLINKTKKILKLSKFDLMDESENVVQIPNDLGDLLIFDVRLDHKSTGNISKSKGNSKFAIFNTFGNENAFTKEYLAFMKTRPEPYYQYLQSTPVSKNLYDKANSLDIKIWE